MLKTKVLVVDDSLFMRKMISRFIGEDPSLQLVGVAKNGLEAVTMVKQLRPDVVTLDVEMPEMNGLEALEQIMKIRPTPVVMLSSLTQDGAHATITALQSGAVDFVSKPSGSLSIDLFKVKEELLTKIKQAAQTSLKTLMSPQTHKPTERESRPKSALRNRMETETTTEFDQIIALGTSTGGPKALETVITALPASFPYPLLVVQHMPPKFTKSLAERLNRLSNVRVVEAEDNQVLIGGTVYIAPGDYHMNVVQTNRELRIQLHQQPFRSGHRPSVDDLFESVARLKGYKQHLVLMTGMGSDGARGMQSAKLAGAQTTIAESNETCVVYGMPRMAIERGCVDYIVPLHLIAAKLVEVVRVPKR